jgi:hypothetical protein
MGPAEAPDVPPNGQTLSLLMVMIESGRGVQTSGCSRIRAGPEEKTRFKTGFEMTRAVGTVIQFAASRGCLPLFYGNRDDAES